MPHDHAWQGWPTCCPNFGLRSDIVEALTKLDVLEGAQPSSEGAGPSTAPLLAKVVAAPSSSKGKPGPKPGPSRPANPIVKKKVSKLGGMSPPGKAGPKPRGRPPKDPDGRQKVWDKDRGYI